MGKLRGHSAVLEVGVSSNEHRLRAPSKAVRGVTNVSSVRLGRARDTGGPALAGDIKQRVRKIACDRITNVEGEKLKAPLRGGAGVIRATESSAREEGRP